MLRRPLMPADWSSGSCRRSCSRHLRGQAKGFESIISFDMGGTSTDVCRVDDRAIPAGQSRTGRVNRVPAIPVRTIGAGGGVSPGSTTEVRFGWDRRRPVPIPDRPHMGAAVMATVTDANVVLGRIPADLSLGGSVLSTSGPRGMPWGCSVPNWVWRSMRWRLGSSRWSTPTWSGRFVPCRWKKELIPETRSWWLSEARWAARNPSRTTSRNEEDLIPPLSGVFSALGLLLASPSSDASRTVMLEEGSTRLAPMAEEILDEARRTFRSAHGSDPWSQRAWAEVRYAGQSHELSVSLVPDGPLRQEFEDVHQAGSDSPGPVRRSSWSTLRRSHRSF